MQSAQTLMAVSYVNATLGTWEMNLIAQVRFCSCENVYFKRPHAHLDVNECESSPCGEFAECTDTVGSFECNCSAGYRGDGYICSGK